MTSAGVPLPESGILPVCKAPGPTSQQVVAAVRRLARGLRAGHAGTLDPAAAGVLPVCVGAATRLADYLHLPPKEYRFELILGVETDTQDATGRIVAEADASALDAAALAAVLPRFVGTVRQRPPLYSARHHEGRRLHELARGGGAPGPEVLPERPVRIESLALLRWTPGRRARALCAVVCGAGTYVRSLCADVGRALGPGACMGALVRHRAGGFAAEECRTLEEIAAAAQHGGLADLVLSPARALAFLPAVVVDPAEALAVGHGRPPRPRSAAGGEPPSWQGPVRVCGEDGRLLAVARRTLAEGAAVFTLECVLPAPR